MKIFIKIILAVLLAGLWSCRTNNGAPTEVPEDNFENTPTVTFNVTKPEYQTTLFKGSAQKIVWESSDDVRYVNIYLYRKTAFISTLAKSAANAKSMTWVIPKDLANSHHYRILVENALKPSERAYSEYFYIFPPAEE